MDNYLEHLLKKIPGKYEMNSNQITIQLDFVYDDSKQLKKISESFKIISDIYDYLSNNKIVTIQYSIDTIKIIY